MLRRLMRIDLFYVLAFNIFACAGTIVLSITTAFVPLAMVIAGVNVVMIAVLLLVRLGTLERMIDHSTRK